MEFFLAVRLERNRRPLLTACGGGIFQDSKISLGAILPMSLFQPGELVCVGMRNSPKAGEEQHVMTV